MTKLILALAILLTGFFAAHDVLAGSSPFAGFYQSKQAGCILRVHVGNDFGGQWILTRSESNNEAIAQCNTGLLDFTEKSLCRNNRTGDLVCSPTDSNKKRGDIIIRADGTMQRADDARFGGVYIKVGDAPTRREGKQ